ncbi:MAG: hydantoinase B/oxoprolinase family protein [Oligoflexus sp.]
MSTPFMAKFYIDVGGTFTDCLAQIQGQTWRLEKFLTSSMIQGRSFHAIDEKTIKIDSLHPRKDFFRGFQLHLITGHTEKPAWNSLVTASDQITGEISLADSLSTYEDGSYAQTWYLKSPEGSAIFAIRWLLGLRLDEQIPPVEMRLGTTLATNALLEAKGCRVGLVCSAGFEDLPIIGDQTRPQLFALEAEEKTKIFEQACGAHEWINSQGEIVEPITNMDQLENTFRNWRKQGLISLAICLKNSYRNPIHEQKIASLALDLGFPYVTCSYQVAAVQKYYERMQTCLLEAYLNPVLNRFVQDLKRTLPGSDLKFMTSFGGLVSELDFTAKDSVLSGPAGGAIGAIELARALQIKKTVAFDMGGTSTDISLIVDERISLQDQHSVRMAPSNHRFTINQPALAIDTIAAGGGSICWFDGVQLRVGPESAGSEPGPACYGRGGPLTVTDLNVYLGRIAKDDFNFPLDAFAIETRLNELAAIVSQASGQDLSREELADGLLKIAIETMAGPIRKMASQQGYELSQFSLLSFGGSGSQLALDLAESLQIKHVIVSPLASVLSAYGIGAAPNKLMQRFHIPQNLQAGEQAAALKSFLDEKTHKLIAKLNRQAPSQVQYFLEMRYQGQDHMLTLMQVNLKNLRQEFEAEHHRHFGFIFPDRPIELRQLIIEVIDSSQAQQASITEQTGDRQNSSDVQVYWNQSFHTVPAVSWSNLSTLTNHSGPLMVRCPGTAVYIKNDWQWHYNEKKIIEIFQKNRSSKSLPDDWHDPIQLSLMSHKLSTIAEEMGEQLARTAVSVNIKERRDFSCALFDSQGNLVVNAPHVPVHLGAMSETIRSLLSQPELLLDGDVWLCNHPYFGGSHLPDVTVITPVFDPHKKKIQYFIANRAHHAEIGGITPGSMPALAELLEEEGVILPFMKIVDQGRFCEANVRDKLQGGAYPSRAPEENLADFRAQIAANQVGKQALTALFPPQEADRFASFATALMAYTARKVCDELQDLPKDSYFFSDRLDEGAKLCVAIKKTSTEGGHFSLIFDFNGSAAQQNSNLNANPAITRAAVMYCMRCLIDEDIPLNEGVLAPIQFIIPESSILSPQKTTRGFPAVVGGNVEISQRLCDIILAALEVSAASQGTMNNITFGGSHQNKAFRFYETIGGGMGGNRQGPGRSAAQVHMTNTRITDVEVLEERFPVRIREFSIRRKSGGAGQHPGGDGICREIECLAPMQASLLTERRQQAPFGLLGGHDGAKGENLLWKTLEYRWLPLASACQQQLNPGDRLRILSPGGGGFAQPNP